MKVVVLRAVPAISSHQADHVMGLKEDIALIQTRLSEKLQEGRSVSLELSAVQHQRDKFGSDNTRLRHRIHYLEAGMKQVRDSLAQTLNIDINHGDHPVLRASDQPVIGFEGRKYKMGGGFIICLNTTSSMVISFHKLKTDSTNEKF